MGEDLAIADCTKTAAGVLVDALITDLTSLVPYRGFHREAVRIKALLP